MAGGSRGRSCLQDTRRTAYATISGRFMAHPAEDMSSPGGRVIQPIGSHAARSCHRCSQGSQRVFPRNAFLLWHDSKVGSERTLESGTAAVQLIHANALCFPHFGFLRSHQEAPMAFGL